MSLRVYILQVLLVLPCCIYGRVLVPNPNENETEATKIAMCRATCLNKFDDSSEKWSEKKERLQCSNNYESGDCSDICWMNCDELYEKPEAHSNICKSSNCDDACAVACNFYEKVQKVSITPEKWTENFFSHKMKFDKVHDGILVTWFNPVKRRMAKGNIVYIVKLLAKKSSTWFEVSQTTRLSQVIPTTFLHTSSMLSVVAINSEGVFAQQDAYHPFVNTPTVNESLKEDVHEERKWIPELVSQNHNKEYSEVEAFITWSKIPSVYTVFSYRYEVSWRIKDNENKKQSGIEITGHLYTETNSAVLSLRPQTVYEIQIEFYSSVVGKIKSEPLIVQTKDISNPNPVNKSSAWICERCDPAPITVIIISVVLICVMLLVIWRVKRQQIDEESSSATEKAKETFNALNKTFFSTVKNSAKLVEQKFSTKSEHEFRSPTEAA